MEQARLAHSGFPDQRNNLSVPRCGLRRCFLNYGHLSLATNETREPPARAPLPAGCGLIRRDQLVL